MIVKVNLKGGFKLVQEGTRTLEITEAKVTPSGAPERLVLTMKDIEDGASLQNSFNMKNETSLWAMGMLLNTALGLNDGDDFNTNDIEKLIGIKLVCEVAHSEYNGRTYANVKKVVSKVEDNTEDVIKAIDEMYGRNAITDDLD